MVETTSGPTTMSGPFTVHTILVEDAIKGNDIGKTIDVWCFGGFTDSYRTGVSGVTYSLDEKQDVVLFLVIDPENGLYWAYPATRGVYLQQETDKGIILIPLDEVRYMDKQKSDIPTLYLDDLRALVH